MKFSSIGGWGRGVEEILEGSLHTLDAGLALLLSFLAGEGNMGKPALAVCEGSTQEGVHGVSFNIMSFAKWEVLEAQCKLSMEILSDLKSCCMGRAFHRPVMN